MKNKSFLSQEDEYMVLDKNMKTHPNAGARKMAIAVAFIEEHGLPEDLKTSKKTKKKKIQTPPLTALQKELLDIYTLEPTEQQMLELKAFLEQLFSEKKPIPQEKLEEMTALAA
jgi:hypothetical protein